VNDLLQTLHITDRPIRIYGSFAGVTIGMVHLLVPFVVLAMIPVIEAVPANILRAAYGLGASRAFTFVHVTLPATARAIIPSGLLAFALTAGAFATPTLLGGGRVGVLSIYIRQQTLNLLNYPRGAVGAVVLLAIVFSVFVVGLAASGRRGRRASRMARAAR
jgi:putative spermidine/putrescine transport system permease protein